MFWSVHLCISTYGALVLLLDMNKYVMIVASQPAVTPKKKIVLDYLYKFIGFLLALCVCVWDFCLLWNFFKWLQVWLCHWFLLFGVCGGRGVGNFFCNLCSECSLKHILELGGWLVTITPYLEKLNY